MTLSSLKMLRGIAPGIIIFMYWIILVRVVWGVQIEVPELSKAPYLLTIIIPSALYYGTPLRKWANGSSHRRVTENIRKKLVAITGYADNKKYSWAELRGLYFSIIDNDNSLKTKASLAYFNGFAWTTAADAAILALLYSILSFLLYFFDQPGAIQCAVLFLVICWISIFIHSSVEKKHIEIGNEQIEIIKQEYSDRVVKRLNQIDG